MLSKSDRVKFLNAAWEEIASDAYGGFISSGRGCIVIMIGKPFKSEPGTMGEELRVAYMTAAQLKYMANDIPNLDEFISEYDPLTQVAIIWTDLDGNYELVQVGLMDFETRRFDNLHDLYLKHIEKMNPATVRPFRVQLVNLGKAGTKEVPLN